MKRNYLIACSLLTIFTYITFSCGHKKDSFSPNVIPLESAVGNYHLLNLSEYATEIRYIPLETSDLSLIAEIKQIICEDEKIVISDNNDNCYLFDNNGKFCCKIGSAGRGPNEYLFANHVTMRDHLIFIDDRYKIIIYDTNGRMVENIHLRSPEMPAEYHIHNVLPLNRDTFVVDVVTINNEYYPKAVLVESNQSSVKPVKEYLSYVQLNKVIPGGFSSNEAAKMYRFKDEVRTYKFIHCDTLFTIDQDTEMRDAFIFELGKFRPAIDYFEYRDRSKTGFIRPENFFESDNHLFITFEFGSHAPEPFTYIFTFRGADPRERTNSNVCGVFDKSSGALTLMKQPVKGKLGFNNDIDNGPAVWPHYISSTNELVTYTTVGEFLDCFAKMEKPTPQVREIAKRITIDDNQIAIIAKLRQ